MEAVNKKEHLKKKKSAVSFRVIKIALKDSFIAKDIQLNKQALSYSVSASFKMSDLKPDVGIEMTYGFYSEEELIFSITVENKYKLTNPKFIVENNEIIERECLGHLIQLSWNHLRGVQSTIIKDTSIDGYYAPVISPSKIMKELTPEITQEPEK